MVMLGFKHTRLRKKVDERVAGAICPGVASNRMICIHEAATINFIKAESTNGVDSEAEVENYSI